MLSRACGFYTAAQSLRGSGLLRRLLMWSQDVKYMEGTRALSSLHPQQLQCLSDILSVNVKCAFMFRHLVARGI